MDINQSLFHYKTFLQLIKDTYDRTETTITLKNQHYGERYDSTVVPYPNNQVLETAETDKVIKNIEKVSRVQIGKDEYLTLKAKINWNNFDRTMEYVHDKATALSPWGFARQKDFLKNKITERCKKINKQEFEISETILGAFSEQYYSDNDLWRVLRSEKNWERYVEFCKVLRALVKDGFLEIIEGKINIDFNKTIIKDVVFIGRNKWRIGANGNILYYPAGHCKVRIKILDYKEEPQGSMVDAEISTKSLTPKQVVKEILKNYKFPKKQKKLISKLANALPRDTETLKAEVETDDLPSLKRDTIATIKKHGLNNILTIKSYKGSFDKYFYQSEVNLAGFLKTNSRS